MKCIFNQENYVQCNLLGSWKKNKGVVTVHVVSKIVYNHKLENSIQNLIIYATWHLKSLTPNKLYNAHPSKTYKFSKFESLVYAVFTSRENSNFLEAIISLLDANDITGPSTASV